MQEKIAWLCNFFIERQIIGEEDRDVYQYCFEILIMMTVHYSMCILIMYHYQVFLYPTIYMIVYMLLRSFIGGWHASNMWKCLVLGLLMFAGIINVLMCQELSAHLKLLFSVFIMFFSAWVVNRLGVDGHENRKLSQEEKHKAKQTYFKVYSLSIVIILIAFGLKNINLIFTIALAYFMATVMLLLSKYSSERRGTDEKQ